MTHIDHPLHPSVFQRPHPNAKACQNPDGVNIVLSLDLKAPKSTPFIPTERAIGTSPLYLSNEGMMLHVISGIKDSWSLDVVNLFCLLSNNGPSFIFTEEIGMDCDNIALPVFVLIEKAFAPLRMKNTKYQIWITFTEYVNLGIILMISTNKL